MRNNWKKYKLGDISSLSYGKLPQKELIGHGDYTIYSGYQVKGKYPEFNYDSGKLLVIARGVGGTGDVKLTKEKHFVTNLSILIDLNNTIALDSFLYYKYLNSNLQYLNSGSAQSQITINDLKNVELELPPLPEQQAIAEILSALDDKIELNLQTNKTLEEMANALYKHWFVDFGPFKNGKFVESELGMIPENFKAESIYSIADVIYGFPFKSSLFNELKNGMPLIRIRDIKLADPDFYTSETSDKATLIKAGDVVAGMDALFTPYIWLGEDGYLNQRVVFFKPKENLSRYYIFQVVKPLLAFFENAKVGTTVIHLGKSDIDTFKTIVAPKQLMDEFSKKIDQLLDQLIINARENNTLKQTRDYLLPKLISGEIRLKNAEKMVKELI